MDDGPAGRAASSPDHLLIDAQRMDLLGRLAPGIAHELANPLAAVMAFAALIRTDPRLPDDVREDAEAMRREADLAHRRIRSLLDFARHRPPERQPATVGAVVQAVLDLQAYALTARSIVVETAVDPDLPPVGIDRRLVQQALLNLVANALEALEPVGGGTLTIRAVAVEDGAARTGPPMIRIEVVDDGPGAPDGVIERAFEPSFTTRGPDRLGLGLTASRAIAEAHGGRLTHRAGADGRGAAFALDLPAAEPDSDAPPSPSSEVGPGSPRPGRPGVLVVDDEDALRTFLRRALDGIGVDVVEASTGSAALAAIEDGLAGRGRRVDVVLSDLRMPGSDGVEVYEAIIALRPDLAGRFALMSGDVHDPSVRRFADERGIRLLAKPFDLAEIRDAVRALIDRT